MDFGRFGHVVARLAVEAENDPAIRKVIDLAVDRLTDEVVNQTPAVLHPVVRHYATALDHKLRERIEAAARDE